MFCIKIKFEIRLQQQEEGGPPEETSLFLNRNMNEDL